MNEGVQIINVTTDNVEDAGIFCIKNKKAPGFKAKIDWFKKKINGGLRIKIVYAAPLSGDAAKSGGKEKEVQLGFIEYLPSEKAWRPINAKNLFFIQCIALFGKGGRNQGIGSMLIKAVEEDAWAAGKSGICTMSSDGPWMANRTIFEKNEFNVADQKGRFELLFKPLKAGAEPPSFFDWETELKKYKGWHLVYADQCPWHYKAVAEIQKTAKHHRIHLTVKKLEKPAQAKKAPSGFGTFSLIKDGRLLADHYISKTRFENILKKEKKG